MATLPDRLQRAVTVVLEEGRPPRGRRLTEAPAVKQVARLSARLENHGRGRDRLILTNVGTVPVNEVSAAVPDDARSLQIVGDGLPIKTLRPGQSVALLAARVMAGGPPIFDITLSGVTDDGERVEDAVTISLYS